MKTIKIKICGYDENNEFSLGNFLLNILNRYYVVEFSENPDYVFYSESTYEYLKYDCIRIFFTGENITPNFNLCDYAFGFDYLNFEDRFFRLPVYMLATFYNKEDLTKAGDMNFTDTIPFSKEDLAAKTDFCSFVYSNYLASCEREIFFNKLSEYRKINAGGKYLNNIGGTVDSKFDFEAKHKFSIAFENSSRSGYTTEKICTSFAAKTIPIYWGNPRIGDEFNTRRFINCHDFDSFDAVVDRIKDIDNNDELYLEIMNEPVRKINYNFVTIRKDFQVFLRNIFDQDLESAKRRTINPVKLKALENNEIMISKIIKFRNYVRVFLSIIYKPFRKIGFLEKLKIKYFQKVAK